MCEMLSGELPFKDLRPETAAAKVRVRVRLCMSCWHVCVAVHVCASVYHTRTHAGGIRGPGAGGAHALPLAAQGSYTQLLVRVRACA
jgi:hypothetical protein